MEKPQPWCKILRYSREYVKNFIRETRSWPGLRVMRSKNSGASDSKFLQVAMRILKRERLFLEKIGRL